jgi:hypothetical protein
MSIGIKTAIALLLLSPSVFSATFPRGCDVVGYGFQGTELILNERGGQAFYMILNRSDSNIDLEHVGPKEAFMSPKLHTKLEPHHWAAFAADVENMHFKCFQPGTETELTINCGDVIDVCQYAHAKFALSNMGSYWVSTNKDLRQVIKETAAKGIYLKWR